jgi:murein DD-endopeptidase MepM/ murein hydrolase activator NlpD
MGVPKGGIVGAHTKGANQLSKLTMQSTKKHMRSKSMRLAIILSMVAFCVPTVVGATNGSEIDQLQDDLSSKKDNIEYLEGKISSYERKIQQKQAEQASIAGEIDILENRIAKTELEIQSTNTQIEIADTEITELTQEILAMESEYDTEKELLKDVLQQIQIQDHRFELEVYLSSKSFSEIFDHIERLKNMNNDLKDSLGRIQNTKAQLLVSRDEQETKKEQLVGLQNELARNIKMIDEEMNAKDSLLLATSRSEEQFQQLLYEVQQEQAYIDQQILALQQEIDAKIAASDAFGGDATVLSWPMDPIYGISAYYHDPTYPFRHLFEHSGIDIPRGQGTPIYAPAPGYVAWTRTGRSYGNYTMIIHANGIATLYAHMSAFNVFADQFVARGDIIGYSGGMPGTQGAGLSTGPHLHFEVRLNGIPVNPMNYLVNY